jgi:regulator of sirC expression with transglutaminase-like and TPR domain
MLREEFAALVADAERIDLARAALTIARIAYPDLDAGRSLQALDTLAGAVRAQTHPAHAPEEAAVRVSTYLFHECGFRGNAEDYYDPRNSFLCDVLERRTGIPISLSVVLIEVAARVGVALEGVGFPGHFLVRVRGARQAMLLDPFFGGREVHAPELLGRYRAFLGARGREVERLPSEALATATPAGILARMLRNLLRVYLEREDHAHALASVDLLLVLLPDAAEEVRLRGLLYEQLECFSAALDDLRRYLDLAPTAPDAADVRARISRLARAAAALH